MHKFNMKSVIHKGKNFENSLKNFNQKRIEYISHELRTFDSETLYLLLESIRKSIGTIAKVTGIGV